MTLDGVVQPLHVVDLLSTTQTPPMDGAVHLLQLIWKGATATSHADASHPKIWQTHRKRLVF